MKKFLVFILLLGLRLNIIFAQQQRPNRIWSDCGSMTGTIRNIRVSGCNRAPCIFQIGSTAQIQLDFTSKVNTRNLINHVFGIVANRPTEFPLPDKSGCSLGVKCPVRRGISYSETVNFPVLNQYPRVNLIVKWIINDDNNNTMICFTIPVRLR